MEGGRSKVIKASSSEACSSPERTTDDDDAGTMRPYYECMFCKRGFTTAQALGGHMNIHRKDRDGMQHRGTATSVSAKAEEYSERYGYNNIPHSCHRRRAYSQVSESLKNYSFCFPASSSCGRDSRVARDDDMGSQRQRELSLFGQELQLGLAMYFDGSNAMCGEEERNGADDEEELDLELRLGHKP